MAKPWNTTRQQRTVFHTAVLLWRLSPKSNRRRKSNMRMIFVYDIRVENPLALELHTSIPYLDPPKTIVSPYLRPSRHSSGQSTI
jgi:hypothetical protein